MDNRPFLRNSLFLLAFVILAALVVRTFQVYHEMLVAKANYEKQAQLKPLLKQEIYEIKMSIERYRKERDQFAAYLFIDQDIPTFLDEISKNAKEDQVSLLEMKTQRFAQVKVDNAVMGEEWQEKRKKDPNDPQSPEELRGILTLSAMPINIRVQGEFESLVRFLDRMQDYKQMVNVSNVEIRPTQNYPLLNCSFTLSIYSLKTIAELQK